MLRDLEGPGGLPASRSPAAPARLRAPALHGAPVLDRRAARCVPRADRRQRPARVLPAADRVLRLRPARRRRARQSRRDRDHELAVGRLSRRRRDGERDPRQDLELAADRAERDPARRQGDRRLPQLDARGHRGDSRRLRRGDPADRGGDDRGRLGREHLHRQERHDLHAVALDVDPPGDHAGHDHPDRAGPRVHGRRDRPDPLRPLPRRRGVHVRHRRRGDAAQARSTTTSSVSGR